MHTRIGQGSCKLSLFRFAIVLLLIIACGGLTAAFAQSTTEGAIGGTVSDPQNSVVPNAVVTIKNTGSNEEKTVTTNSTGFYRLGLVPPGTYTLNVKAQGFALYEVQQVIVTVGSLTTVNPRLTIGASEKIEVSAEAPVINTTSADFAPTLNSTAIENLPINGGRWSSFVLLTPGVVSDSNGFGLVSFRGISTLLNNVTVDGADNNQAYFSEERGRTRAGYSTPKVAIDEFQVNTSNYSSEYGRSAGGVINSVTKSGTNTIHGEGYWYDRDNSWGSTNPFTTLTSAVYGNGLTAPPTSALTAPYKPVDVRKMGGFGVGGAIIKDKLFWYVAYDRYHHNFPGTAVPNSASTFFAVPDAALAGGTCPSTKSGTADYNVCQFAALLDYGSTSSANLAKVTAVQYGTAQSDWVNALFGNPNTGQLGLIGITGPTPRTGDQDIFFPKLDWIINQKNHASFEVNRMRWWSPAGIQTQSTNAYGTNSFGNDYVKDTWGVAKLDTQFTNTVTNQFRVQYGRDFEFEFPQNPSAYELQTLINPVTPGTTTPTGYTNPYALPPNVYIGSFQWGTAPFLTRPAYPNEYKTQVADTISMLRGNHSLKFGVDFVNNNDKINNLYQQYAEYSYSGLPQYFANLYDPAGKFFSTYYQAFQGTSITNPVQTYQFSTKDLAFFAQDDWKISRRLTLNAGLRFETELMPGRYTNLTNTVTLGSQTISAGALPNSPKDWGPRVGFAWDIFGDSKTVLRGGYGIYYGRIINSALFTAMTTTGSTAGQNSYSMKYNVPGVPTFPDILTTSPSAAASLSVDYFDPNFKSPQINEIDLSLQREVGWQTFLSISYLGSLGRHLQNFTDANLAAPGTPYCSQLSSGKPNGAQATGAAGVPVNGVCGAGTALLATPPTTVSYVLSNSLNGTAVNGLPLSTGYTATLPYYTSRVNPVYGTVTDIFSGVNSNYNALSVQVEKRFSNHVQFSANYTWSHALDNGVNGTTGAGTDNLIDPHNPGFGLYGDSLYNVPNRFTLNAILEAPWKHSGWMKYLVDGWQAAPVVQLQNGLGNNIQTATSYPNVYVGTQEYQTPGGGMLGAGGSYQIPGTERDGYRQPNTYVTDLRFSKEFPITERYKFQFSADGFNIFNHVNVTGVNTTSAYTITSPSSGTAGATTNPTLTPYTSAVSNGTTLWNVPTSANSNYVYGTRQIQFGVHFLF